MAAKSLFGSLFGRSEPAPSLAGQALAVVGTASHVGKSWTATAICRVLRRRGLRVAPFKATNMSLNSFVCPDGGEIGRSQAAQAEACGLAPRTDMNPLLLKPSTGGCQAVLHGKVWKEIRNGDFSAEAEHLRDLIDGAFERLADEFDFVVIEGSGGCAELNLRGRDLANLELAARLGAPALLVADIRRGGVFASVLGTLALLEPAENRCVRSFLVNRFQGDRRLFDEGRRMLETRAEKPCLGVFPDEPSIHLDDEDSVSLEERRPEPSVEPDALRVAIVRLPNIANTTDFRHLPQAEYITEAARIDPDLIIVPGTKNTVEDLAWMKRTGLDRWILDKRKDGTAVWGICGGFQMLGRTVADPYAVESGRRKLSGLGLLPVQTTMRREKTTRQVRARLAGSDLEFEAYEIHMGETTPETDDSPFCFVDGEPRGYMRRGIIGHYLHGALENPRVLETLLSEVARWRSRSAPRPAGERVDREQHYDRLADWFEASADMRRFEELYL